MNRRRLAVAGAVAACILLVAAGAFVGIVSWRSAEKLVHPAREVSAATPADIGLAYERVELASDVPLVGWWMPAPEPRGVVIFLHGYGDAKDQSLPLASFLHNASYHVLAFDFRAHGESAGDVTTVGLDEVRDVASAIRYAEERDPAAAEDLVLFGYSMGAAAAINAAAEDPSVDAIIADSAFATLTNIASNSITHFTDLPRWPYGPLAVLFAGWIVGKDVDANTPVHAIQRTQAPTLVIQGLADTIARPDDDGRALAAAAPPGSELWLVPHAAHVEAHGVRQTEYESRVVTFLDRTLR